MKRTLVPAIILIAIACALLPARNRAQAQNTPPATQAGKTAEQYFKNIQVMKEMPAESVQPAMQFISASLGVECEFCHVQGAFEKDDKKTKVTARKMIEMQMAINRDSFKGQTEVTCYSCHRGAHDPVGVPVIAEEEPKRTEPEKAQAESPALPTADQILDKYVQAVGGAEAVQKVSSRVESGTVSFGGQQFPVEVLAKAPNKRISIVHTPNGDNITAFDGTAGWLGNPGGRPPRDMNAQEVNAISFDATFYLPIELKKMFTQFRVRPAEKIGGHDVIQLIGITKDKTPLRLFFDKESGLLLRTMRYAETPLGRNPTQVDYADYRSEGGVKIPFQWTVARPAGRFTIHVSEAKQNVAIDDAKFAKPAAPAPPAAK
jgi:photosynthetic reaction center cytochrome c subunit